MVTSIQVPQPFVSPLEALAGLPEPDFQRVTDALEELPPFGARSEIETVFESTIGDSASPAALAYAITSLVRQFPDLPPDELGRLVSEASSLNLTGSDRETLAQRLVVLVQVDAIKLVGKADDVITDHEHVVRGLRIITDVRPVFADDLSASPAAAVIVSMLRIDHTTDRQERSMYFALDEVDLALLKEVTERAVTKTETLKKFLASAGLTYVEQQEVPDASS